MIRLPDQAYLASVFHYDRESGRLFHREQASKGPNWNGRFAGKEAGSRDGRYVVVKLDGVRLRAHRIIWKMHYGTEPENIDHIDGCGRNNRLSNLRECTRSQNMANSKSCAGSGLKGAYKRRSGWISQIHVRGELHYLGFFKTAEQAHQAYATAAHQHFGEFARAA